MPTYFKFTQGTESRVRPNDSSPLLGRFRAVPPRDQQFAASQVNRLDVAGGRGSVHVGYGALVIAGLEGHQEDDEDDDVSTEDLDGIPRLERLWQRWVVDLWVHPRQAAVKKIAEKWYTRYGLLVFLPAVLTVGWCSLPFPQYPLPPGQVDQNPSDVHNKAPGHGNARVQVNFWFFIFVYYGLYSLTALIWITKVFNLYSLNWWPQSLGFPLTFTLIAILSVTVPIPIYYYDQTRFLTVHNTSWISWTFIIMALPVTIAVLILRNNERHLGLRNSLSETQRIFTASWWTNDVDTLSRRERRRGNRSTDPFGGDDVRVSRGSRLRSFRQRWLPASFVRFIWFCVALYIGLMAYVLGEAYAEIYLRTLPHDSFETLIYVYGWVVTVHLLDALTGFVLGIREGERVGSYPLSWVFKLYFMLTYQTYVRALYARLRSPGQFIMLQIFSSTGLVVITPIMMTTVFHKILTILGLSTLSYGTYQKLQTRNVFIRFLAENASMACFLGSILVLHYGANKDVYPYFAFDDESEDYDFDRTFYLSTVTWGCELIASLVVRGLIRVIFGVDVGLEGKMDLAVWPELLPTCVVVILHVLQNMLFSIIRLQFRA
ncbi:unnamed protein product [Clonostachys rhizophaga]|uniref:Uncharacterized protein n=1 Tax=Clonostachys rhizophaga TaxID=160324 RepID=A0A9N9VPZ6_9HYPO|nr:unnamed protein product [Clonostachys rhizophaga]